MELAVSFQLYQASAALLLGVAAGLFYDVLRIIRHRIRRKAVTVSLDMLYWLALAIALFAQTMIVGHGFLQMFLLLANCGGAVVYFIILSAPVLRILGAVVDTLVWISLFLTKPMRKIWSKGRKWTGRHKKGFQNRVKQYIINLHFYPNMNVRKKDRAGGERSAQKKKRKHSDKNSDKSGRTGFRHLHIDYADRPPQSDRERRRSKGANGACR